MGRLREVVGLGAKVDVDPNWECWGGGPGRNASAGDGRMGDGSCVPPKRDSDLVERLDMRLAVQAGEKDEGSVTRRRKNCRAADRPRRH